ncbi:MAG: ribonuclease Y, partial [Candidatus Thalassarchaeaceae archaeon]|nr:ribonuclease Y [Candidatus Thalassarchaeaceae archaeon]
MEFIAAIGAVLVGLAVGGLSGYFGWRIISSSKIESARQGVQKMLDDARVQERALLTEARDQAQRVRSVSESERVELRERRSEVQQVERRVSNREENVERRANNLDGREEALADKEKESDSIRMDLEGLRSQELTKLEEISNLSEDEARGEVMRLAEEEMGQELAIRYRDMEESAKDEATDNARNILGLAIQRLASDVVSEATLTSVPLPTDEMKGRLIGREGRNIRAIEKATGIDLIIDDTPEAVTLSGFDPIRRETARLAVTKLIADGRIHPARIEEMVSKSEEELMETIKKAGDATLMDTEVRGVNSELAKLLGRLKYRFSYGENVLQHSIEVAHLAGMMASEIGVDVKVAKMGGLLHDIGKALTHEIEGPHAQMGADVAAKNKIPESVVTAIAEHHDDDHSSIESFLVAAADAISAARPGSRRDTVEHYIQRLEALEDVARAFDGVERCFAIQAGREIRIIVQPDKVDDVSATTMARDIVKKIEETLTYPGQIK